MTTAGDLVDRVYREWLYRPDDAPTSTILTADVAVGAQSFPIDTSLLSAEEMNLITLGGVAEVGQELVRINAVFSNSFSAIRGWMGTTPAAYSTGAVVYLAPQFPRRAVFDAVADSIADLFPDLWHTRTLTVTTGRTWVEVPSETYGLVRARAEYGDEWVDIGARFLREFPESRTNVAVQFPSDVYSGRILLTLKQQFTRPTSETSTVSDIETDWESLVVLGAVVTLLASTDVDAARQDFVTETFQNQGFPVGSGERLSRAAIRLYEYRMQKARDELALRYPVPVSMSGVTYGGF